MKLLIIDSDRDLVEMLTSWLKTLEYEVYRAYNSERARSEWLEQRPDLVIIDPMLKGVDVLEMCRDLRAKHDTLMLILTDSKDVQDEVRCLESGADDYLYLRPWLYGGMYGFACGYCLINHHTKVMILRRLCQIIEW